MNWQDTAPALAFSVALHLMLVGAMFLGWSSDSVLKVEPRTPKHVQAVVIERPAPTPPPARPAPPRRADPAPTPKPAPKPAPTPAPEPKPKPEPTPKPEPEPAPAPSFEQPDLAELLAGEEMAMQESQRERDAEAAELEVQTREGDAFSDEQSQYLAAIRAEIERRWTRPPSARVGMELVLRIRLAPGGDLVDVSVIRGSGDAALDRSAVAAVNNAGRLPVPSGSDFEPFRDFQIIFRPEDLRL